ncbi:hypothetical protein MHB44_00680 [Lysinibacillus sp. FSL H8-0500]|uniref:hypothetical protein n=1 Tax=Lysinibacillus sp. FSL H8-0500 TaxID=2921393 RepID=UPI003101AECB
MRKQHLRLISEVSKTRKQLLLLFVLLMMLLLSALANVPERPATSSFVFAYQNMVDDDVEKELNTGGK